MIISSEFRMGQYRDDDHREDALHFDVSSLHWEENRKFPEFNLLIAELRMTENWFLNAQKKFIKLKKL